MSPRLAALLREVEVVEVLEGPNGADPEIRSITHDTGAVSDGALFCCVPGRTADGHDLAPVAIDRGAAALLVERRVDADATQVAVESVRRAMGPLAAAFHGRPSAALTVVGVTGTNGKTTTTHLLAAILRASGTPTDVYGNLDVGALNTPEAPDLQARLAASREAGRQAVAMEVTSDGLAAHRVDGTTFTAGVFTNLTRDHLNTHGTMEAYFAAKASLFEPGRCALAVVNADDEWGRRLLASVAIPTVPFAMADAADLDVRPAETTFSWRGRRMRVRLPGGFNVANALAAATAAAELGVDLDAIAAGLDEVCTLPGRMESVDVGQPFTVLVDYAHTPDALESALSAARSLTSGRVVVVFGCGGDRDAAKRPEMGDVASRLAELAILTTDNPRTEDPGAIIEAVRAGAPGRPNLVVEPDRRLAIAAAVGQAAPGDVVLIAGKGHETGQVVGTTVLPFDDRAVAAEIMQENAR